MDDEEDICAICLDPMAKITHRGDERVRMLCCGQQFCASCEKGLQERGVAGMQELFNSLW